MKNVTTVQPVAGVKRATPRVSAGDSVGGTTWPRCASLFPALHFLAANGADGAVCQLLGRCVGVPVGHGAPPGRERCETWGLQWQTRPELRPRDAPGVEVDRSAPGANNVLEALHEGCGRHKELAQDVQREGVKVEEDEEEEAVDDEP